MRPLLIAAALLFVLLASLPASAQSVTVSTQREDSAAATTSWDSTWVGPGTLRKQIEIQNDGSVYLRYALNNDTTAGMYRRLAPGEKVYLDAAAGTVRFVRTKAVSSTCIRRVATRY